MVSVPLGSSEPAIQRLREVTGLPDARNQVAAGAGLDRVERMIDVAGCDHHVGAGGGRDLAGLDLGAHAAARVIGRGVAGHRFDLGGDARHQRNVPGVGVGGRRRVVEAVDVGQQHQQVGARHRGDAGGEAVVVAVADLGGGDGVVLVDDRHAAPFQELADGRAGVEIAPPLLGVVSVTRTWPAVMPCWPSASAQVRASAIWPTAAAAWLSSSFSAPFGSLSTERPSAIAPDDTTMTSRLSLCSRAMSAASESSHASFSRPAAASTSSDEPTLMTMRRKSARAGALADMDVKRLREARQGRLLGVYSRVCGGRGAKAATPGQRFAPCFALLSRAVPASSASARSVSGTPLP